MELELWTETNRAITAVAADFPRDARDSYCTADIVRVYHWACLHDRHLGLPAA